MTQTDEKRINCSDRFAIFVILDVGEAVRFLI